MHSHIGTRVQSVSRVLSRTIIYLGWQLPTTSSEYVEMPSRHFVSFLASSGVYILHKVASVFVVSYTPFPPLQSNAKIGTTAVYFCCTVLGVASTGSYPAPLLCDARTFLVSCPTQSSNCLLLAYCTTAPNVCQVKAYTFILWY